MTNQIPEKTNNNDIEKQFNEATKVVRRVSRDKIISMMIWISLAVAATFELYGSTTGVVTRTVMLVLISVFEAECLRQLIKNILIHFTNGNEFQEAVKATVELDNVLSK